MLVELDNVKFRVQWRHEQVLQQDVATDLDALHWVTTVSIVGENGVSFTHWATCSPRDQFSKERGRKISLARAIQALPRESRTVFWQAYHGRKAPTTPRS